MFQNDFDLPQRETRSGFPWMILIIVVVVTGLLALGIISSKSGSSSSSSSASPLEQQLDADKAVLDTERQKVFDMTAQLEEMKQAITSGSVPDKAKAVGEYNRLAAAQAAQREKVKTLAAQYNQKVVEFKQQQR